MTITTMTLDELKDLPPLTDGEKAIINAAKSVPTDDCPAMTAEELKQFTPWYEKEKQRLQVVGSTQAL